MSWTLIKERIKKFLFTKILNKQQEGENLFQYLLRQITYFTDSSGRPSQTVTYSWVVMGIIIAVAVVEVQLANDLITTVKNGVTTVQPRGFSAGFYTLIIGLSAIIKVLFNIRNSRLEKTGSAHAKTDSDKAAKAEVVETSKEKVQMFMG